MKKLIIFFIVIAMVIFFSIPSMLFAETGDEYTALGENSDGQYEMDIKGDYNSDPDTDVFCIDDETDLNDGSNAYTETDEFVSDVLQNDGEGGNFGEGIDEENAEAVEILATTATGGTPEENQEAVWDIINDDLNAIPEENSDIIENAVMEVATEFVNLPENNDGDDTNDVSLQQFLDDENINELEIVLDPDPLVDPVTLETNTFEAEAIMENPLVPTITDEEKVVFWYIMEGSYNVSFSETDLVVTASSTMFDRLDDADGENDVDNDGDGDITGDNYGYSTVQYYYYWWGEGYAEFEEMNVNLFAWVDIDEDEKLDITDLPGDKDLSPGDEGYKDGDVVGDFIASHQVIATQENPEYDDSGMIPDNAYNSPHIIVDENNDDVADTVPITETETPVVKETICGNPCEHGFWWGDVNSEGQRYWVCWHMYSPHSGMKDYYCEKIDMVEFEMDVCEQTGGKVLEGDPIEKWVRNYPNCNDGEWNYNWVGGEKVYYWSCDGDHECDADHTYSKWNTANLCSHGHWSGSYGSSSRYWNCDGHKCCDDGMLKYRCEKEDSQRFVIENYSEPFASASQSYEAWGSFEFIKTNSSTGLPVAGATYLLSYVEGQTFEPDVKEFVLVTDADGKASIDGLPWGIYTLQETSAPAGYFIDPNVYTYHIGGNALFMEDDTNVLDAYDEVTNVPVPPSTGGGETPLITVAGITEEESEGGIQVLGIQELPFTGFQYIIMLIGVSMIITAGTILAVIRKRQTSK